MNLNIEATLRKNLSWVTKEVVIASVLKEYTARMEDLNRGKRPAC